MLDRYGLPLSISSDAAREAYDAGADCILLDNFDVPALKAAVAAVSGRAKLEASGGFTRQNLREIAETGVDYASIGALTKNCSAVDLSMRFFG